MRVCIEYAFDEYLAILDAELGPLMPAEHEAAVHWVDGVLGGAPTSAPPKVRRRSA